MTNNKAKIEQLRQAQEKAEKQLRQMLDKKKLLIHQTKQLERKERTHRLIQRGAMLEKFLQNPLILSDDAVMEILKLAFDKEDVRSFIADAAARAEQSNETTEN